MSHLRNIRGQPAAACWRMAMVLWSGWAAVLGCGLAEEGPEGSGTAVAPEPAAVASTAAVTKASNTLQEQRRDPFWPVDYVRPVLVLPGEKIDPVKDAKVFEADWREVEKVLHGTSKNWGRMSGKDGGDRYFVLINGKAFDVGDVITLPANGKTYRWRVASISLQSGPVFERILPTPGAASSKM